MTGLCIGDGGAASRDPFLGVVLKCRCRILFTTRSRYENHISLEVGEGNLDAEDKIGTTKDGRNPFSESDRGPVCPEKSI